MLLILVKIQPKGDLSKEETARVSREVIRNSLKESEQTSESSKNPGAAQVLPRLRSLPLPQKVPKETKQEKNLGTDKPIFGYNFKVEEPEQTDKSANNQELPEVSDETNDTYQVLSVHSQALPAEGATDQEPSLPLREDPEAIEEQSTEAGDRAGDPNEKKTETELDKSLVLENTKVEKLLVPQDTEVKILQVPEDAEVETQSVSEVTKVETQLVAEDTEVVTQPASEGTEVDSLQVLEDTNKYPLIFKNNGIEQDTYQQPEVEMSADGVGQDTYQQPEVKMSADGVGQDTYEQPEVEMSADGVGQDTYQHLEDTGAGLVELQFGPTVSCALSRALVRKILQKNKIYSLEECHEIANRLDHNMKNQLIIGRDSGISQRKLAIIGKGAARRLEKQYGSFIDVLKRHVHLTMPILRQMC
ncbi:hypothetical protein WMY93_013612 [Mugilogobius chulae]|uniref:Uncharacterized protein n=1 Tax=Mugilogobius chulae TaxID=88201 RepID=A0AAW0P0H2_9GOBI